MNQKSRRTSSLHIDRVVTDADRRAFLQFPYWLYRNDPNWIPRLWPEQMAWLRREHGFFEHADAEWYLARRNNQVVGTIGVAIDHPENQHLNRRRGVFGFFESIDDEDVFHGLIDQAREWLSLRDMTHMLGPRSFTGNDYPGFLVGRHDVPAALYEGHTPPYYLRLAELAGWETYADTLAYRVFRRQYGDRLEFMPEKISKVASRLARNPRYGVRHAQMEHFDREFEIVLRLFNRALSTLPEFVPMEANELRALTESLLPIVDEELIVFAMVDGKEVGFSLAIPNAAEAFHKCGGLRRPWHYLQFWWAMRNIKSVSYKILATDPDYWGLGLEALMFHRLAEVCIRRRYEWMDGSLTGGDNPFTNKLASRLGFEEYKRYRIFKIPV